MFCTTKLRKSSYFCTLYQKTMTKDGLLKMVRTGKHLTFRQQIMLVVSLSVPAILAQISVIIMQYIDAAMVGSLGANASASIGLVATTTWLFGGLCSGVSAGFSVQVAHRIGAHDEEGARAVLRQALISALLFSLVVAVIGVIISDALPMWLGGSESIHADASAYFMIYAISIPVMQIYFLSAAMLRCSGNMLVPSLLGVGACTLDVIMNAFFIFPTRTITVLGLDIMLPGFGLGVVGAALGTLVAFVISAVAMFGFLALRSKELNLLHEHGNFKPERRTLQRAVKIGAPMMVQHAVMCSAQILTTVIVAPLGTFAIAANSFAITAESLCYMPGYGVSDAATTLVGQSLGAGRPELMRRFAIMTIGLGMVVMALMGLVMYMAAPLMMEVLSPVEQIQVLGIECLRIEAWAEPMFAASIVAYGVFVGAGDTIVPSGMNLASMWAVRLTLAAFLAPIYGLQGVWMAMCAELTFRGLIFLIRLAWCFKHKKEWIHKK